MPRILVVQPRVEIRNLTALLLQQRGYETAAAANVEAARGVAGAFAAVVLDLAAPGVDPRRPALSFRARAPQFADVPILLTDLRGRAAPADGDGVYAPERRASPSFLAEVEALARRRGLDAPPVPVAVQTWNLAQPDVRALLGACTDFGFTGSVTLRRRAVHKTLYYDHGELYDAASSEESEWLGKLLLAQKKISELALNQAERAAAQSGRSVGDELVDRDVIDPAQRSAAKMQQREAIAASVLEWRVAEVSFADDAPPPASPKRRRRRLLITARRQFALTVLFYLALGFVLANLPLTNYLGLEFSLATAVAAALLGGPLTINIYRWRTAAVDEMGQRERAAHLGATALWGESAVTHFAALVFVLLGLAVRAATHGLCAPARGVWFFVLSPMVTVAYVSAWGLVCGSLIARRRLAVAVAVALPFLSLIPRAVEFLVSPVVWFYNPFFGYFPGPIYDQAAAPEPPLIAYRIGSLAQATLLTLLLGWLWRRRAPGAPRNRSAQFARGAALAATAAIALGIFLGRFALGFGMDDAHLKAKLDGRVVTPHFDIYYPRRADIEREIALIARDHEFRFAQIERELGIRYAHRIQSFIYPDEETKKKLIGAGGTEFAHCATHQMHLNWERFPIDILHHEMVHVMLGDYGLPLLGFSAKVGAIEGMAVAHGGPTDWRQDLDVWAAGLKAMDRLPPIRDILGVGFWGDSGARAYVAAGSFVRYLTSLPGGREKTLAAYRWGDFAAKFGRPLNELERDWRAHLAAIEIGLTDAEIERARFRFGFKSIFETRCAREAAATADRARREAALRYDQRADLLYREVERLERDPVHTARLRLPILLRLGRFAEAARLARDVREAQGAPTRPAVDKKGRIVGSQVIAFDADMTLAQIAWAGGDPAAARSIFAKIAAANYRDSAVRQAVVSIYAIDHPAIEPALRKYFTDFAGGEAGRWSLILAWRDADDAVINYLQARRALDERADDAAAGLLSRALAAGLPDPSLTEEAWRALGETQFRGGEFASARRSFAQARVASIARGEATADLDDWLVRIDAWPTLP